jgi:hypothetical protein
LQNLQILQKPGVLPQMPTSQPPQPPAPVLALEVPPMPEKTSDVAKAQPQSGTTKTNCTNRSVDDITKEIQSKLEKNNA